ncbi:single-strand selective monofunctional uracil DNA glycosylase-like isoform X3 [Thrips palmi]|uniref:Single-strand selective monofunctional uracil DNA glycosylase-like isoform X3 n=1 Tax=Thrips palmi TaxID=161013 RepID=A0A6P8Z5Y9_THRPL|nr:single-strand selective monofunctional uracil DNA glycosylase-like isoform X3 [Thrips palmi]
MGVHHSPDTSDFTVLGRVNIGYRVLRIVKELLSTANNHKRLLASSARSVSVDRLHRHLLRFRICGFSVPFGEVSVVKDWFGLQGSVKKPKHEHPSRLIQGLDCRRSEVSGKRFWGLFREICGSNPYLFFKNCFIYNQCPIALMSDTGKNITPAELKASESKVLLAFCDKALTKVIQLLKVHLVVGIGKFAEKRACIALNEACLKEVKVVSIPHPSPRNAHCSGNWKEVVAKILTDLGILDLLSGN